MPRVTQFWLTPPPADVLYGRTVAIKRLNKRSVHLTREVLIQLKQVISTFLTFYSYCMSVSLII